MINSIAWRNIWRNKVRSLIVLTAVAIGLFAGVFSTGFYMGMADMRFKTAIKTEFSHIRIQQKNYQNEPSINLYFENSSDLLKKLKSFPQIEGASRRVIAESMAETAHGTKGVKIIGFEPENERLVSDIHEKIIEGEYLTSNNSRIPKILVGSTLAKELKLKVKSKLKITVTDKNGHINAKLYKVGGIYKSNNTSFDKVNVFVLRDELLNQTGLSGDISHQIAIFLNENADVEIIAESLHQNFKDLEVLTWRNISKELALMADQMNQLMYIFVVIIMLALCFGIINTMLMAVLERKRELGMLMAVGMSKAKVFRMIILESIYLSLTGGLAGIIIGYGTIKYFEKNPINIEIFSGFEMYGYPKEVTTILPAESIVTITFMVIFLGIISAVYPALKAIKLNPSETIREE